MTTMSADSLADTRRNVWLSAGYAGLFTAILAVITSFFFEREMLVLYIIFFLLIGAGPVLGYQMANGRIFSDWKSIIGGIIGTVAVFLGWPILVGLLTKEQPVGKLFLGSLLGIVLGVAVFFLLATMIGQNPYWVGTGFVFLAAVWGGTVGAAMEAWRTV